MLFHDVRIGRRDRYAAGCHHLVDITDGQFAVQHIDQIAVAGMCGRERLGVLVLHVIAGDIGVGQQAEQMVFFVNDRQGVNAVFAHVQPGTAQRSIGANAFYIAELHLGQTGRQRVQITGRFHTEAVENILGLHAD